LKFFNQVGHCEKIKSPIFYQNGINQKIISFNVFSSLKLYKKFINFDLKKL